MHRLQSDAEVWVERAGSALPLDDLLIERFALAMSVALSKGGAGIQDLDDSALLRLAADGVADEAQRRSALSRLGIDEKRAVHALAVNGPSPQVDRLAAALGVIARGPMGSAHLLVSDHPCPSDLGVPIGTRIGIAPPHPALQLPQAWREAATALRFALPSKHDHPPYAVSEAVAVDYRMLGGLVALSQRIPPDVISAIPDVQALDRLAADPHGDELLHTLEVVASTESIRRAASMLHLHHNSVAHRVARAETVLGFSISAPYSRFRLMLALVLHRLRDSTDLP